MSKPTLRRMLGVLKLRLAARIAGCLLVATGCLTVAGCREEAGGEAADLIREVWASSRLCEMHLGEWTVVEGDEIFFGEGISWGYFKTTQQWERAGLVSVAAEDVLSTDKTFSWNDWFARTQRGELKRVTIQPTERGLELASISESGSFLQGPCYRNLVLEIVSDEEVEVRTERYRVVQATMRRELEELGRTLASVVKDDDPPTQFSFPWGKGGEFKLRILLRWDVFDEEWKRVPVERLPNGEYNTGIDLAASDRDFQTRHGLPPS